VTPSQPTERAVVAKRVDAGTTDTEEITDPRARCRVRRRRRTDPDADRGPRVPPRRGKVDRLANVVARERATAVIFDNQPAPTRRTTSATNSPTGRASSTGSDSSWRYSASAPRPGRLQLQVELAELRYELPRAGSQGQPGQTRRASGVHGAGRVRREPRTGHQEPYLPHPRRTRLHPEHGGTPPRTAPGVRFDLVAPRRLHERR